LQSIAHPKLYHLTELKDDYHRYIVLLALQDCVSIVAVKLGDATVRAGLDQSGLRTCVGSEWARIHYCDYQAHRGNRFVHGKIAVLQELMRTRGHTHLILAGDPGMTAWLRHAMPGDLAEMRVDMAPASARDRQTGVIMVILSSLFEHEYNDYRSVIEYLIEGLRSLNLTVAGPAATLDALSRDEVDTRIMAGDDRPGPGWTCTACRAIGTEPRKTSICPAVRQTIHATDACQGGTAAPGRAAGTSGANRGTRRHADDPGRRRLSAAHPLGTQINKQTAPAVATS
jgi:hypothetical protein